jgi:hypothetical protein
MSRRINCRVRHRDQAAPHSKIVACCSCLVQRALFRANLYPAQGLLMQQQIERGKRPSYVHVHSIPTITLTFWWLCLRGLTSRVVNTGVDSTSHG